jgi:predicted molibdopterin-dependent oxidoreductase YjgC
MVREGEEFVEVEMDEALDVAADSLRKYQGSTFAALISPGATNEESYTFQQFTRGVMGSNNIDRLMSRGQATVEDALLESFGVVSSTAGMHEMQTDSNMVLVVGPDIGVWEPIASYWLFWALRYREVKMVVVRPEYSFLCERSNNWIPTPEGTEADVLNAMAKIILDEGLASPDAQTDSLKRSLATIDIEAIAQRAGITADYLKECAILYATGGKGVSSGSSSYPASAIWYTASSRETGDAGDIATAANNLAILTGNIGRPGGGVLAGRRDANMQGTADVGCHPLLLPGGRKVSDATERAVFSDLWADRWITDLQVEGVEPIRDLPSEPGVGVLGLAQAIETGQIRAMYISAQSHKWSAALDPELLAALPKLEFLVVEDCFESELTQMADVVLPAAMYLEKDGSFTNLDRTVQRVRFAVSAPGDAHPTTFYASEIAQRLGYRFGYYNASSIMDEIATVVPGYNGIAFPRLERAGMQWPVPGFGAEGTVHLSVGNGLAPDEIRIIAD